MGARATTRGLSYQVKSREVPGGRFRPFACATCHPCGTPKEIRLNAPHNNPELIQQKFRAEGWDFDAWNASHVICPSCLRLRREARRGESGRKGGNVLTLHTTTPRPQGAAVSAAPAAAVAAPPAGALPPNKTELTVEERGRVRDMLVGTFDEKAGQYSEGWSDQRVAREAGDLPPKLIADLREVAYGPLRSIVEIEPMRAELDALAQQLGGALERATACQAEIALIQGQMTNLRARFDETAKRLGVRLP